MPCGACGTVNASGRRFCSNCGAPLALECPACGTENEATDRFCGQCGTTLASDPTGPAHTPTRDVPTDERRLVSVLFVDLVGFTSLSETRDAEDVRGLLSRYFDTCSTHIGRHGGVVEKFIGDAVMAVWGSPVAREDDAERAVLAALEIIGAVEALGEEIGVPDLRARAGVLTGEAAVSLGAEAEGMVLGDMVNTASRIQSAARSGTVMVGDATKWATEARVAYEDGGIHEMKGKTEPIHLWRALRATGGQSDWDESAGLEAPFVGRERELRLVKETYHASADEARAHLVSVIGTAGVGKTRLAREFGRYLDALVDDVFWHRGRCPSYGEGLTYWALVEMVKMRCGIAEEETGDPAAEKLTALLAQTVPDEAERRWMEPRLASLLSLDRGLAVDRDELFSAWSLLFERLADDSPTVLIFEDLHFADSSLLDFIGYLLERARDSRLFILTLARPELTERRPDWGAGQRSLTSLHLEPLAESKMEEVLSELVPGLPEEMAGSILDRAQGVPLYAVETVRMLLDRGLVTKEGSNYRATGSVADLAIPETLQALIAARLDGLDPQDRMLVQDGAVLGKSFFKEGVAAVADLPIDRVESILTSLVRREVLTLQSDPRSPDRGQYSFLQDLVRQVAYGTISKRDRKAKHLAAASFIVDLAVGDEEEVVEVVANHYLLAHELEPGADDAADIRDKALDTLRRAAERAAGLGASVEAQSYLERAAGMTDDPLERAAAIERAGEMALMGDRLDEAGRLLGEALGVYEDELQAHAAARASAGLAEVDWGQGRLDEALERMEKAYAVLSEDEPDEDLGTLAAQLGRLHYFRGDKVAAMSRIETALDIAETLNHPETIAQALITMGAIVGGRRRQQESALVSHALGYALEHDLTGAALRAYNNQAESLYRLDRYSGAIETFDAGIAYAGRIGNRFWSDLLLSEITFPLFVVGRWDDALAAVASTSAPDRAQPDVLGRLSALPMIHVGRGDLEAPDRELAIHARYETSSSVQERISWAVAQAVMLNARGDHRGALIAAEVGLGSAETWDSDSLMVKVSLKEAIDAAWALNDAGRLDEIVRTTEALPSIRTSPVIHAFAAIGRARLAIDALDESEEVDRAYGSAASSLRECGARFWLATTLVEHAEWCDGQDRPAEAAAMRAEAKDVFQTAGALVWLQRLEDRPAAPD